MSIVFAADLHLSSYIWSGRSDLYGDAEWALHQLVDIACERQAEWLVAAGDLIDKKVNDSPPIDSLGRQLKRLVDCGVQFGYVQGQHEMADPPWVQTVSGSSLHLHGKLTQIGPFLTYGLDYQRTSDIPDAFGAVPKGTNMVIAHQVWEEFMGSRAQASMAVIPHAEYCITGDFHKFVSKTVTGKTGQKLRCFSPGATHMRKIDEPDEHYCIIWDDGKFVKKRLHSRPFRFIELNTVRDLDEFCANVKQDIEQITTGSPQLPVHIRKPIFKIKYRVELPEAQARILNAVNDEAFVFEEQVWPETESQQVSRQKRDELVKLGLEGCLELIVPDKESPLYSDTLTVLQASRDAGQIADAIASIKERFLGGNNVAKESEVAECVPARAAGLDVSPRTDRSDRPQRLGKIKRH